MTAPPPPDLTVTAMAVVSGNAQKGPVNTQLAVPLRVRVLNAAGHPVANAVVDFVVTAGGGHMFGGAEGSDANGYAQDLWTLGPKLGPQTVAVRNVNGTTGKGTTYGTFTATALPPHTIPVVIANGHGIAIMNADGSGLHQLTSDARDSFPDLSPDHTKIVFTSTRQGGNAGIWLMNADGSHIHAITGFVRFAGPPSFSPDGTRLVFLFTQVNPAGPFLDQEEVLVTDTSGTVIGGWIQPEAFDLGVGWSADGQVIIYASDVNSVGIDIYTSDISALHLVQLTNKWCAYGVAESPDGQHIAFIGAPASEQGCPGFLSPTRLYLMNPDGGNITAITGPGITGNPSWSPDNQYIGTDQGLMNADGSGLTKINGGGEGRFAWR